MVERASARRPNLFDGVCKSCLVAGLEINQARGLGATDIEVSCDEVRWLLFWKRIRMITVYGRRAVEFPGLEIDKYESKLEYVTNQCPGMKLGKSATPSNI